jgi:hypothetical protein
VVAIDSQAFLAAHATEAFSSPPTFLVEACITVPGGSGTMYSGYLWREYVGGVHPTADSIAGKFIIGEFISQYDSCDDGGSAYHRLVHC